MVVALVLHTCRKTEEALAWYKVSRERAIAIGDDVELAALVHNMAWIRVYNYRNALLRGEKASESESEVLRVSSEAVGNYEELVGLESFPALTPLLRAQTLMLDNEFSLALEILNEHADGVRQQGLSRLASNFNADRAYCLMKLGCVDAAWDVVESILDSIDSSIHADDLAVLYSRLRDCAQIAGKKELQCNFDSEAQRSWRDFDLLVSGMLESVRELLSEGSEPRDFVPQP
jgi:hypothetical protein